MMERNKGLFLKTLVALSYLCFLIIIAIGVYVINEARQEAIQARVEAQQGLLLAKHAVEVAKEAELSLAKETLSFNLTGIPDDQILPSIEKWRHDLWGVQVGGLRLACKKDIDYVNGLVSSGNGNTICRAVK